MTDLPILLLSSFMKDIINIAVRTSFGLDPKIGMYSGPTSPNNKLVERGRKS